MGKAVQKEKPLTFSDKTEGRIENILKRYPKGKEQSAVIPVLKLAQDEFDGWLSTEVMNLVAERLDMPYIRVYEVATFYTMFNLKPVGKYHVQVCTNCSCMIRGSEQIVKVVKDETSLTAENTISKDGLFTLTEVECLGACVDAPMMQVNNRYYTHLTESKVRSLIKEMKKGEMPVSATPTQDMKEGY
jgi:NADH-quinone oxidoreductase E subunit